ncbi:MAG: ExbD/TolR family protein [Opitutales bacterium]
MKQDSAYSSRELPRGESFTAPLGLMGRLKYPIIRVGFVPVLDLLVLALLFSLLFTRFVAFPGVHVNLPVTDLRIRQGAGAAAVLTIEHKGMLLFDGKVYDFQTIEGAFHSHMEEADENQETVLLVKAQASMELEAFLELCRMAQEAGFAQIQIAGAKSKERLDVLPMDEQPKGRGSAAPTL